MTDVRDEQPATTGNLRPELCVVAGEYRDRPVFLLTCTRGMTAMGTVTVNREGLASLATQYGLVAVDRYLSKLRKSEGCRVVLTESSMYIEHGRAAASTTRAPLDQAWARQVSHDRICIVLLALGDVEGRGFDQVVRQATGTSRCMGALIDVIDARPTQQEGHAPYVTIGPWGGPSVLADEEACAVLDSNVVINLEKAALGQLGNSPRELEALQSLMVTLVHRDVIPGFAISETVYSVPATVNRKNRRVSLRAAIDAWFDHGMGGVLDVRDLGDRYRRHCLELQGQPMEALEALDGSYLFGITYPSLLKLDLLWSQAERFRARQRLALFEEYCRFVNEEVGYVSAQTLQIAIDLLLGRGPIDYVQQLLKPGKPARIPILRGAAWDLLFLFVPEMAESEGFDAPAGRTVLVTADRALPGLRQRMLFRGMTGAPGSESGVVDLTTDIDPRLDPQRAAIDDILDSLKTSIRRRSAKGRQELDVERLGRLTATLEEEVGRSGPSGS